MQRFLEIAIVVGVVASCGTAGAPRPEEAYAASGLIALADARRVIIVRPRSRSAVTASGEFFQWDINPGDLQRNQKFALRLVEDLQSRFPIDPARIYATGYSSGSNMASQFLYEPKSPFHGLAPIAGGHWSPTNLPPLADGPRMYLATGYRDYLWPTTRDLVEALHVAGLPDDRVFVRRSGGGHEIHDWYFDELWQFLDAGARPAAGNLASPWTVETVPTTSDLNALAIDGGVLVAAGAHGQVLRHELGWTSDHDQPAIDYASLCFAGAQGFVGGAYAGARRDAAAWADATVPDYGMLGSGWINGLDCRADGSIIAVGYWSAAISGDGGVTWSRFQASTGFGLDAWMAGIATSPGGATVIAGYYYLGRAAPGTTEAVRMYSGEGWWNAVAAGAGGRFWAVGDHGAIATSSDDGRTWRTRVSGTTDDLYAVHFADATHGAAAGQGGTVLVTSDGGLSWTKRPLGRANYVGAVYVDATQIWIAGEDGLVARSPR